MKRIICALITAVLAAATLSGGVLSAATKYPEPTERFFVNDFADVIDSNDEDEIFSRAVSLQEATTAQVAVVSVNELDGEEPADYALGLGREWGVGVKGEDNGIVILFAKDERQIYIAVGGGLEGALPDSKTGRIIDRYGLDYLKANDFSVGLLEISKAIINEVYIEYGAEPEAGYTAIDDLPYEDGEEYDSYGKKVAVSWVAMIAVVILFTLIFGRRRRGFIWFGGPPFGGGGFGGGFGGGSGFGGGHGGGFGGGGGFSGGGGSFGGGGAGRGF